VTELLDDEAERVEQLVSAETRALELFDEVQRRGVIRPGATEVEASAAIRDLAADLFGVTRHWHKRIVRAGPNTLQPYRQNPPDRVIEADDIVFLDFGPVFSDVGGTDEWEADVGRTFVLGDDPVKQRLCDALPVIWAAGREHFRAHPDITGEQLFQYVVELAERDGWEWGGRIAGHIVGQFPHEEIDGADAESEIVPGCTTPLRRLDQSGRVCHWILEVHLVDRERQIGGFHEQLLDIG
jgi:Xaa-Pro aminopeptidase